MKLFPEKSRLFVLGCGLAILYGLAAYAVFLYKNQLGSLSYLALVPIGMATLAFAFDDPAQLDLFRRRMFVPWVATIGVFLLLFVIRAEALLCAVILAAPVIVVSTLWYWIVHALRLRRDRKLRDVWTGLLLLLPFIAIEVEERFWISEQSGNVVTEMRVAAAPPIVWANIVEVAPLHDRELPASIWNHLGVPRPLEARVTAQRAGGTRLGRFEGGLRFIEPIRVFEPEKRLELEVHVDRAAMPADMLLEHTFSTGYFRLHKVAYTLEPSGASETTLRLACTYSIRSGVNAYGHLIVQSILGDFERSLLQALRARAEREQSRGPAQPTVATKR